MLFQLLMAKNSRKDVEQQHKNEEKKESRVRDERQEALREKAIKNITKRPGYGRSGRSIHVLTNYFEIKNVIIIIIIIFTCFNYYNRS
jgi:hypothetical protein